MLQRQSSNLVHGRLECGIEYGVAEMPERRVVAFQLRVLAGISDEPPSRLGLARIVEETIDKGTQNFKSGRELSDAFDLIGAGRNSGTGRETTTFTCTCLPEHFERAVELHAEILGRPTFPQGAFEVNVELTRQETKALQDDPQALVDKMISPRAFGAILGRHPLGEPQTIETITVRDLQEYWKNHFHSGRLVVSVAGPLEASRVADVLDRHFSAFGKHEPQGRRPHRLSFTPGEEHHSKELAQQQVSLCWPGVDVTHVDFPIQQVLLGVLSGGMSGRLFTEVREKQGLVYWVSAWQDTPRGSGILFMGASTTPERCELTFNTLLREVSRLSDDLTETELERAKTGIIASWDTRGDATRARCSELASDLFFHGRPVPVEEKVARIQAVSRDDVRRYLESYRRDRLCVMTLGPKAMHANAVPASAALEPTT